MDHIPIEFDYENKHNKGFLVATHGMGGNSWQLMINNYYYGQLMFDPVSGWKFLSNKDAMSELAETFGEQVMLWYG